MGFGPFLSKLVVWAILVGLPLVQGYLRITCSIFLNVEAEDAKGIEKIANYALTPVHYLLVGKRAVRHPKAGLPYRLEQQYEYRSHFLVKTATSLVALPVSLTLGSLLKTVAFLSEDTRERHRALYATFNSKAIQSNNDYYESIGIDTRDFRTAPMIRPTLHPRRPGEENKMPKQKEALRQIVQILKENHILFWVDCGTCLGTYRHAGIIPWDWDLDIAILKPDFENVRRLLMTHLDRDLCDVQDWSGRDVPESYLKVYVKGTDTLIDIYHFAIDEKSRVIRSIFSNEENPFLFESMKIRERRYTLATPFNRVFPLRRGMFDGIEVPVPNQIKRYLQDRYGENIEPAKIYNPISNNYEKDLSHPYWQLPHAH